MNKIEDFPFARAKALNMLGRVTDGGSQGQFVD